MVAGEAWPDCVGSLDVIYGLDSFECTLETGTETGSNAKLLIRCCWICDLCRLRDNCLISSSAWGDNLVVAFLDRVESDRRLCAGSISSLTEANLTA